MPEHKRFRDAYYEETGVRWRPWKWFFVAVGVVLIVWLVFQLVGWITQPARTAAGVRERVGNADNALFQYEKFHAPNGAVREVIAWTQKDLPLFEEVWDVYYAAEYAADEPSEDADLFGGVYR